MNIKYQNRENSQKVPVDFVIRYTNSKLINLPITVMIYQNAFLMRKNRFENKLSLLIITDYYLPFLVQASMLTKSDVKWYFI
jgi:hypothetical protein